MAAIRSLFGSCFISLVILLLHLGCFIFPSTDRNSKKKRKVSPLPTCSTPSSLKSPHKALSSSWSFVKRTFYFTNHKNDYEIQVTHPTTSAASSARSSQQLTLDTTTSDDSAPLRKRPNGSRISRQEHEISLDHPSFPLRNDIFPCPICGEVFQKTQLLEQHQSIKHAVSELFDGDSGKNIVQIIFNAGWDNKGRQNPIIHQILKIHNSPKILSRFEEYRETVKSRAARSGVRRRDERCIADGNELLRFHCSTFACGLGQKGNSSICNQSYCSVCGIIRSGFSAKMDGISTLSSSWRAHVALPDEIEAEFAFMNVKRAMLVCRVVAGRIGCEGEQEVVGKEDAQYDSLLGRNGGAHSRLDADELFVFNPRAVLPCFVIIYSTSV
ncbi:uncharacterized protein LOC122087528 [Macadamia integrifolia]|uniref:uncharacterized protein LOC122087528 n=1 Tax=Macadamia integrifolia TaxID=60698 RepID=UPI001C4F7888|nr:uncharacterized protein LOC122087528 [Macadamia integrifolia]